MRSRMALLLAFLALAVAAWAGDPWKEKTYKEWNQEEVNKILADSPWSRPVSVLALWRVGGGSTPGGSGGGGRGGGQVTSGGENPGARGGGGGGGGAPEAHFVLRWGSTRTAREALARLAVFRGMAEADAEKIMNVPVTDPAA